MSDVFNIDLLADRIAAKLRHVQTKRLLSLEEAAQYLGMTEDAVRHKVYNRKIPTVKLDSRMRFDVQDLDRLIADNKIKGTAA